MKLMFVYSQHSATEKALIERVKIEMSGYVDEIEVMELDEAKEHFHIRATPCLIPLLDHLQGENLLAEGVDGKLLLTAEAYKMHQEEELAVHQAETHRLDNFVMAEKQTAIDDYTLELVGEGLI